MKQLWGKLNPFNGWEDGLAGNNWEAVFEAWCQIWKEGKNTKIRQIFQI